MNGKDVRTDIMTNNSEDIVMTMTHKPTGLSVQGEGDCGITLRIELFQELRDKVEVRYNKGY